ncbi:50S ribosomal protein L10 [Portibacter marinus]|uniref:50S ribosomal protein L10 n=1 Tax=Portibacter marinus TaxID=2898660 RepID=UPI001F1A39CF|nr:50S ribosomal protein L10 [Portibacter marinus]
MNRTEKTAAIEELKEKFSNSDFFYLTDSSKLTVEQVNRLRGLCYAKGIEMKVVKNTLAKKALESFDEGKGYQPLMDILKGPTAFMFTDVANDPAKVIKEFRGKKGERPVLKAAYIDQDVFIGDDQIDALASLKSKEDLIGEIVTLLQSPIKNVIGSLQSGGNTIAGLVKALQERSDAS